jgi:hypothetical protein
MLPVDAITLPLAAARLLLRRLLAACAIGYPLERRAAILIAPDVRADERELRRRGAQIAANGSHIRLPVPHSDYPWKWLREPGTPAVLPLLSHTLRVLDTIPGR